MSAPRPGGPPPVMRASSVRRSVKSPPIAMTVPRNFLGHARCGDTCIYHKGNLTYDMRTNRILKAVVAEVRKASADGTITLTQRSARQHGRAHRRARPSVWCGRQGEGQSKTCRANPG